MKTLIAYYSRTGTTKKVAESIAKNLKADIEEVIDRKDRSGAKCYLLGGRDAMFKKLTEIAPTKKDPSKYGLVLLGTPIWAGLMAPAVRTYISKNKASFKNVAFFCTMGGSSGKCFEDMEKSCGKKPKATLELLTKEVAKKDFSEKIKVFCHKTLSPD